MATYDFQYQSCKGGEQQKWTPSNPEGSLRGQHFPVLFGKKKK